MAGFSMVNQTPYAAEPLFLLDKQGRDRFAVLVQATFDIVDCRTLALSKIQEPIPMGGEWHGEPGLSSCRYEPQIAPMKPATDVVLIGHAYPEKPGDTQVDVRLRVGKVGKTVRVFGNRYWRKRLGEYKTSPQPFEKIPLIYEKAFGGWDRRHADASRHRCEPRNPVGVGFRHGDLDEGMPLPNLEDPRHLIESSSDTPPPAGFGFLGPEWRPRSGLAGTYGKAWEDTRMPLLPEDFDERFYNAAHPDLIADGYLRGDEEVVVENASPGGLLWFSLPGVAAPSFHSRFRGEEGTRGGSHLDSLIIDADAERVLLQWRGSIALPSGIACPPTVEISVASISGKPGEKLSASGKAG